MKYRAGIDIGGTFTDLVLMDEEGSVHAEKLLTTPDDFGRGIAEGLAAALRNVGAEPGDVDIIVHGTTVATNAILEAKGAATGLITTEGFRDVLELRRLRIPEMYSLNWTMARRRWCPGGCGAKRARKWALGAMSGCRSTKRRSSPPANGWRRKT